VTAAADSSLVWRRFPTGRERIRAGGWLARRREVGFLLAAVAVVGPVLVFGFLTTRVGPVLGMALIVAGPIACWWSEVHPKRRTLDPGLGKALLNQETALQDHWLYCRYADPVRYDLNEGTTDLLGPSGRRGKAWVLVRHRTGITRPVPVLLLSDPRSGRLRDSGDLDSLAAVLLASPHESDHAVGRHVQNLAAAARGQPAPPAEIPLSWEPLEIPGTIGLAFRGLLHAAGFLLVPLSCALALGWIETSADTQPLTKASELAELIIAMVGIGTAMAGLIWLLRQIWHLLLTIAALIVGITAPATEP
jgi:hypothetical protein